MSRLKVLEKIAKDELGLETLKTIGSQHADCNWTNEYHLHSIKKALEHAYKEGYKQAIHDSDNNPRE